MVQFNLSALLCILTCFVIEMVPVKMRFKSSGFIFFIGFNLCIRLFFFIVVLYFSFENFKLWCVQNHKQKKVWVCTVNRQYVMAGEIKRRTLVFYNPSCRCSCLISCRLQEAERKCVFSGEIQFLPVNRQTGVREEGWDLAAWWRKHHDAYRGGLFSMTSCFRNSWNMCVFIWLMYHLIGPLGSLNAVKR